MMVISVLYHGVLQLWLIQTNGTRSWVVHLVNEDSDILLGLHCMCGRQWEVHILLV
jgi:hypothetical protein